MNTPAYSKPPFIKIANGETFGGFAVAAYQYTYMVRGEPVIDVTKHKMTIDPADAKETRLFGEEDFNRLMGCVHEKTNDLIRRDSRINQLKDELQTMSEQRENQAETIEELNELVGLAIQALACKPGAFSSTVLDKLKEAHLHGTRPVFKKNASDFVWQYRTYSGGQTMWTNTHHSNVQALRADGIEVRCMAEITKPTEPFVAPGPEGFGLNPTITLMVPDAEAATMPIAKVAPFLWDGRTAETNLIGTHVTLNGPEDPELVYNHIVLSAQGGCSIEALEQMFAGNYGGKLPEVGQEIKLVCTGRTDSEIYINMRAVPAPHHKV